MFDFFYIRNYPVTFFCLVPVFLEPLNAVLSDYEVVPLSDLHLHSVRKRDVHTQSHLERLVSFRALHRYSTISHLVHKL